MNKRSSQNTLKICGSIILANRSKLQAVKCTESIVRCAKHNIFCFKNNAIKTAVDSGIESDCDFLVERNCHNSLSKRKFSRNYNFNGMFANNLAAIYHLSCYLTYFSVRDKDTILNSTHGRICKLPSNISRNFRRGTYKVGTKSRKLNLTSGSIICTLSRNISTCKSTICRSGSNKENTSCSRTLCTVRRRVVNLQLFTRSLRNPCCRSTTITVNSPCTTEVEHNLCKLVHRHTCRIGRLTTVINHNYNRTIGLNTNNRTRSFIGMIRFSLIYTIFYDISAGNRNNLIFPAVKICSRLNLRHLNLGNVCRTRITVFVKILVNNKNRGESYITVRVSTVCRVKENLGIKHNETKRLTYTVCRIIGIPAQAGIHRTNYVTVA